MKVDERDSKIVLKQELEAIHIKLKDKNITAVQKRCLLARQKDIKIKARCLACGRHILARPKRSFAPPNATWDELNLLCLGCAAPSP